MPLLLTLTRRWNLDRVQRVLNLLAIGGLAFAVGSGAVRSLMYGGRFAVAFAAGLVVLAGGLVYFVRRIRRVDHGDAPERPPLPSLVYEAIDRNGWFVVLFVLYPVVLLWWMPEARSYGPAIPAAVVLGTLGMGLAVVTLGAAAGQWARRGVERQVFVESTCIAFLATLTAAALYGLVAVAGGAPQLPVWVVWPFGMAAWGAATSLRTRRMSA